MKSNEFKKIIPLWRIKLTTLKIARDLNKIYKNEDVVIEIVRDGACPFAFELLKHLKFKVRYDFISVKTFVNNERSKEAIVNFDQKIKIECKNVLIIDEFLDTGVTSKLVYSELKKHNPKSIGFTALLWKSEIENKENYKCIRNGIKYKHDDFLVGYGLDVDGYYRNLPYIAIIKKT